ncbi:MAG: polysaccharide deacetylase family protein, partial [Thermoleophilia bacterium]|nr:polysaccharide deacetylase family protein [Thermoleophilia bacterium]
EIRQVEREFEFTIHTARPVRLGSLETQPDLDRGSAEYLCLEMEQAESDGDNTFGQRICLGGSNRSVGATPIADRAGKAAGDGNLLAEVTQPSPGVTTVRMTLAELGLPFDRYRFRFISSDGSCSGSPGDGCVDRLPADGDGEFNLRTPALVKCEGAKGREVRYGPRDERQVALTFDDGPGTSTPDILEILREKRASGTFFLLGTNVKRDPDQVRAIVEQGSEVGNHSMEHDSLPDLADLEATNDVIEEASGVRPCAFRPPYGNVDSALVSRATKADMDTVLWDVDTEDWTDGATVDAVVEGTKLNAQFGSIILMHDGGDRYREITIAALPSVIDELRDEGYSFVTVSELLGSRLTYQPLGEP